MSRTFGVKDPMAGFDTDAGFQTWLDANGYTLPDGAPNAAVLRNRRAGYVYGARSSGIPTGVFDQERAWPRTDVCAYGVAIKPTVVPFATVNASYADAWAVWPPDCSSLRGVIEKPSSTWHADVC